MGDDGQWADIAEANGRLLTQALEKLAAVEQRERDLLALAEEKGWGYFYDHRYDNAMVQVVHLQAEVARMAAERDAQIAATTHHAAYAEVLSRRLDRAIRWAWSYRKLARADRAMFWRQAEAVRFHTDRGDRFRTALATIAEQARTWDGSTDPWESVKAIETCARQALEAK